MAKRKKGFLRDYLLPRAAFLAVGFPRHAFGSIDITNRCNLRCQHCYFFEQNQDQELTDEQWQERIQRLVRFPLPFRTCTWVGGEPLLRSDLIARSRRLFDCNIVVTNGTIPLPDWPDVRFHVSVDGTEAVHEQIRGQKGIYARIKRNADRPELQVTAAYCISNVNKHCLEETLAEWRSETSIRGMMFDFYTPIRGLADELYVPEKERDRILNRLIALKEEYGDFIALPARALELMKSKNMAQVIARCPFRRKGFALDARGVSKSPCMLGEKADCSRCGCVVPYYLTMRTERRYILRGMAGDLRQGWRRLWRAAAAK